jgi:hypothetical protein
MIISHSRKFIFIHLHKTAGESVSEALRPYLSGRDLFLGPGLRGELNNAYYNSRYRLQKHSGTRKVQRFVGEAIWDDYLTFSFVRDPVDRARSLYFYYERMLQRRQERSLRNALLWLPGMRDPYQWPGMQAYMETGSFSEFIRHPKFSPSHGGTRRQADLLCDTDGRLMVDLVGRYETLQQDFASIAARLGLEGASLGWRNASRNRAGGDVSETDQAHLAEIYRDDYALFYPGTDVAVAQASTPARPASSASK